MPPRFFRSTAEIASDGLFTLRLENILRTRLKTGTNPFSSGYPGTSRDPKTVYFAAGVPAGFIVLVLFFLVFFLCFMVLVIGDLVAMGSTANRGTDIDTRNKAINAETNNFFITDSLVKIKRR